MAVKCEVPQISIVVTAYNVEKYIANCIESLQKQTLHEIEIIIVDDGSTDSTPKICDEYACTDKRIRVIHKINGGLVSARKAGAKVAIGRFIGCVDGDDFVEPEMYKTLLEAAEQSRANVVECQFYQYYEETGERKPYNGVLKQGVYQKDALRIMLYPDLFTAMREPPSCCNKIFERELYYKYLNPICNEIVQGEDFCLTYPLFIEDALCLSVIETPLYNYRIRHQSMSHGYRKNLFRSYSLLLEHAEKAIRDSGDSSLIAQIDLLYPSYMVACILNESLQSRLWISSESCTVMHKAMLNCTPRQWNKFVRQSDMGISKVEKIVAWLCAARCFFALEIIVWLRRLWRMIS